MQLKIDHKIFKEKKQSGKKSKLQNSDIMILYM